VRRFLRWLVGVPDALDYDALRNVLQNIEDVRDDVEHLGRRFTKLQGQVTRSWRDEIIEQDDDPDEEFTRLLEEKRRSHG